MKSLNLKSVFVFLLSIVMLVSISACSTKSDADSDAAATSAPAATDAATAAAAATDAPAASGDVVAAYSFTNTGSVDLCELYLSTVDKNDWGPDQLGGATIPVGQKFTLKNVPAGKYDAKVVGCNGGGESSIVLDIHN